MRRTRVKRKCPGQNTALKPTNSNSISGASQAGSSISKVNLPNTAGITISHTNSGPRIKYFCSFGQQTEREIEGEYEISPGTSFFPYFFCLSIRSFCFFLC